MVTAIKTIASRHVLAITVSLLCTWIAISNHLARAVQAPTQGWDFSAPAPPPSAFIQAFLVVPGFIAAVPFVIVGVVSGLDWLSGFGTVAGAAFFWYGIGWYIDCATGVADAHEPPKLITVYMRVATIVAAIAFPILVFVGLKLHSSWNAPPLWADVLMYGIVTMWVTVGTFFAFRRFRMARNDKTLSVHSDATEPR